METREIKFRAWDKTNKNICDEKDFMMSLDGEVLDPTTFPFTVRKDVILMQFTGLLDKNGKEIYEGDIIEFYPNVPFIVEWDEDTGKMSYCQRQNMIAVGGLFKSTAKRVKIIGNIYSNPELLNKPLTDDNQPIEIDVDGVEPKGIAISVGKGKTIFSPNGEIKQQTDDGEDIDELVEEEPADVCEYCEGTGKVPKLTLDTSENMPSGGEWVDSGELETCICRIEK